MFKYTRNPFTKKYTDAEQRDMRCIHDLYLQFLSKYFNESDPNKTILEMNEDRTLPARMATSFSAAGQTGIVFTWMNSIRANLIQYLEDRSKRLSLKWWETGYPNDPISLLCMLIYELSAEIDQYSTTNLIEISKSAERIEALLTFIQNMQTTKTKGLFTNEPNNETSFYLVLYNIEPLLKQAYNKVELEKDSFSSREYLKTLSTQMALVIENVCQYLFYALNNDEDVPVNVTIPNLLNSTDPRLSLKTTRAKKLLDDLIHTPEIQRVFNTNNIAQSNQLELASNRFLTAKQNCEQLYVSFLNESLANSITQSALVVQLQAYKNKPLGIRRELVTSNTIVAFIKAHGFVQEFAYLVGAVEQAKAIAGNSGDIGICILRRHEVMHLLEGIQQVKERLAKQLIIIDQEVAKARNNYISKCHKLPETHAAESMAAVCYQRAVVTLNQAVKVTTDLLNIINHTHPEDLLKQFAKNLDHFDQLYDSAIKRLRNCGIALMPTTIEANTSSVQIEEVTEDLSTSSLSVPALQWIDEKMTEKTLLLWDRKLRKKYTDRIEKLSQNRDTIKLLEDTLTERKIESDPSMSFSQREYHKKASSIQRVISGSKSLTPLQNTNKEQEMRDWLKEEVKKKIQLKGV